MRFTYFYPLIGFVVPTIVVGYGVMIPHSCIAGMNELTIGFGGSVLGACLTYWVGIRRVYSDQHGERTLPSKDR